LPDKTDAEQFYACPFCGYDFDEELLLLSVLTTLVTTGETTDYVSLELTCEGCGAELENEIYAQLNLEECPWLRKGELDKEDADDD